MTGKFSSLNLGEVPQLRRFKIDYTRIRNLDYVDADKPLPRPFEQFRRLFVPAAVQAVRPAAFLDWREA